MTTALKILKKFENECDCKICQDMCKAPCCGTASEIKKLIQDGYSDRLMIDEWDDGEILLKPALKGYEGKSAPFHTSSEKG